jgi:hypothetical protein
VWYSVRITVRSGDGVHSITVSHKTFAEIRAGIEMLLRGDGFGTEQGVVPDYWEFNADGLSSVRVYCDNGRQLYRGELAFGRKSVSVNSYIEKAPDYPSCKQGAKRRARAILSRLTAAKPSM